VKETMKDIVAVDTDSGIVSCWYCLWRVGKWCIFRAL